MITHQLLNDDAYINIKQFQQEMSLSCAALQAKLIDCYPFTSADEGEEVEMHMQHMMAAVAKRLRRQEQMVNHAATGKKASYAMQAQPENKSSKRREPKTHQQKENDRVDRKGRYT